MNIELPAQWKDLNINGTIYPNEHVDIYITQMSLYTINIQNFKVEIIIQKIT